MFASCDGARRLVPCVDILVRLSHKFNIRIKIRITKFLDGSSARREECAAAKKRE